MAKTRRDKMFSWMKILFGWQLLILADVCLSLSPSMAQTNTENFAQFKFNFNNPGARATGVGGAFISIADDATAAEANPAGLAAVIRPEISFETKGIKFKTHVNNFSHTENGADYSIIGRDFENSVVSPSFASAALPFQNLTFSAFRYELVNFKSAFFTKGSFVSPLKDGTAFRPISSTAELRIVNWGGAIASKFSEYFSIGVSLGLSRIDMKSSLTRYNLEVFDESTVSSVATIDDSQNDLFFNIGLIVRPLENLSLGAIYKKRPEFGLQQTFRFTDFPADSVSVKRINFKVPSSLGFGVSYRPIDVLTLSFDAVRITYSRLTEDFVLTFSEESVGKDDFVVDDGMEYHAGAEYVLLLQSFGIVFRGGFYIEPDNRIRWAGKPTNDPNKVFDRQVMEALFQAGETNFHTTFGLGLVVSDNFQFDVAGNLSTGSDEIVGSFVVRF